MACFATVKLNLVSLNASFPTYDDKDVKGWLVADLVSTATGTPMKDEVWTYRTKKGTFSVSRPFACAFIFSRHCLH